MNMIVTALLALLNQVLPLISAGGQVASVISTLESILPLVVKEVQALYQPIKNMIAALQSDGTITADQIVQLKALDSQVDAAYDAAMQDLDPDVTGS